MRALVYFVAVSLDGCISSPDDDASAFPIEGDHMSFLFEEFPDTIPTHVASIVGATPTLARFDTVLMGWNTYVPALEAGIERPYAHLREIVFTRRHTERDASPGIEFTSADPVTTVRALKQEEGADIWLCGGAQLAGALIGEIDRLILKRNPILLGAGKPLFSGASYAPSSWRPVRTRSFTSGVDVTEFERMH
ncbi:MAG: dihydrofolate reductase family protein [Tessaracoccus sp.]